MNERVTAARRILVVDDEPFVCEALEMMLSLDGHDVVTARGGAEALALFDQGRFDLLITDYAMPGMKGDALAAAVKSRNPNQPIIMVTAFVEKLTGEGSPLVHIDKLVGKPFRFDEIKEAIAQVLGNSKTA